jgi:hypothetical protein
VASLDLRCHVPPPEPSRGIACAVPAVPLATTDCDPVATGAATPGALPDDRPIVRGAALAFLAGSGMTVLWLFIGSWMTARLLARTAAAPAELRGVLLRVVGEGGRVPGLRIAPGFGQPFVVGVFRPTIVLPARFAGDEEPEARVEAALRHEWAHIGQGDLALLALLRMLMPLLFAHPLFWRLRRRVRADQEALADARAVEEGDRLGYAEALLTWARAAPPGPVRSHSGALALWDRPGELRERVALLLTPAFPVETRCPGRWRLLVVSTALALVVSLAAASLAIARASAAEPPHDCRDCLEHAPPPSVFCCPPGEGDAAAVWSSSTG